MPRCRMFLSVVAMCAALIVLPIGAGALFGMALRRLRGRRFAGIIALIAFLTLPVLLAVKLVLRFPLIGVWDALLEAFLVGAGVEWTAHRAFAHPREVALTLGSLITSLLVLELVCRVCMPAPPGFPTTAGPHLLLADAMRAGTQSHSWDLRSKEIVCSIVYEEQYPGILDVSEERDIVAPRKFTPRVGATRRVLHIGDSMTFGIGVSREETFTADLERLEPGTQHINGGIPGTAPDAYFLVLRQWLTLHDVDLAVMYVFEGNDLAGLDDQYPCCDWQSLLTYGSGGPAMRCPTAARIDFSKAGGTWLRYNSPPPYLVRALIPYSSAAAYIAAVIVSRMPLKPLAVHQSEATEFQHLESILRAVRDAVRVRRTPFVVVVLPSRTWAENRTTEHLAPEIVKVAQRLNLPALDTSDVVREAVVRGQHIFFDMPLDPHFSAAGHAVIARWLHDRLAAAAGLPPP